MKKYRHIILFGSLIMAMSSLAGCNSNNGGDGFTKIEYEQTQRDRYNNIFRDDKLPEQWDAYGVGDPYILRYNGEYYLYCSTKNLQTGYKVWKSRDLVNFEYLGWKGIYNANGTTTNQDTMYAPEVYYWNGDFYMYGSPGGRGHYVYKSDDGTPFGNFYAITNNFGCSIDGTVFIDDDENKYFMTASGGAIRSYLMNSMTSVNTSSGLGINAPMGNWTEGPCMIKHDGTYYLTFTGNSVTSNGYRINYTYGNDGPRGDFTFPFNNSLALKSIESEQLGLGHSSTVLGPNLDSYYISYHSLDSSIGPIRSYNIDRISFSHNRLNIYGPTTKGAQVAMLPDFVNYAGDNKMSEQDGLILSNQETGDTFSAEYNFKEIDNIAEMKLLFGVKDGNNNNYVSIADKKINLYIDGSLKGIGTLKEDFNFSKLHTVRIHHSNGRLNVFFDNLKKIDVQSSPVSGGKIGYSGITSAQIGTTTFSNDAFESSDRKESKIIDGDFFAEHYLKEYSKLSDNAVYEVPKEYFSDSIYVIDADYIYSESNAVKVKAGEYVTYPVDVLEDNLYGVEAIFKQNNAGSRLSIQIDNEKPVVLTLQKNDFTTNMNYFEDQLLFIKNHIAEVEMKKGLHTVKFEVISGEVDFVYFNFFKDSKYSPDFTNDLSKYVSKGANYLSLWKLAQDDGVSVHKALSGSSNMILFGNQTMTDYEVEVDIKVNIVASAGSKTGLIVRCNNPSINSAQPDYPAQGYLVSFDNMQLELYRINYNYILNANHNDATLFNTGVWHHLKVTCKGNLTSVDFDNGKATLSYRDPNPFSHGLVCLYSIASESLYKNLSIKGI